MTTISRLAPAKLNLGLEITGRRPDGYHDLVTIMQTVTIYDELSLQTAAEIEATSSVEGVAPEENLAGAALRALKDHSGVTAGVQFGLDKHIPIGAGLGGASSDAAAVLLGADQLWGLHLPDAALVDLATGLGSDVPFFLSGGTALVTGRGELIQPLPDLVGGWFVVVAPAIVIPRKTATLYAALRPADWSSGERVRQQAARIRSGRALAPELLGNAFARPLFTLRPRVATVQHALYAAGAPFAALSGAGPSHYTFVPRLDRALAIAAHVEAGLGRLAHVFVCEPVPRQGRTS